MNQFPSMPSPQLSRRLAGSDDPEMADRKGLWAAPKPPPYVDLETDLDR